MPRPELLPLHHWPAGVLCDGFALLAECTPQKTREGKPYLLVKFADSKRGVSVAIWADHALYAQAQGLAVGGFYKLRGSFTEHARYGPTLELQQYREVVEADKADGFLAGDYYECSPHDPAAMFADLVALAEAELHQPALKQLVLNVLHTHREALLRLPATERHFYPYPGGWLEHVRNVARNCVLLVDAYTGMEPPLDRDLVLAGAILHDIGRVREFDLPATPLEPVKKTVDGQLFGHIDLGRKLVAEAAAAVPDLPPELLRLLDHVIHTHLTLPEWGSPRLPAIPEVLVLHHADDLDAKLAMYARVLRRDTSPGPFTDSDPILRRVLLKQRGERTP